MYLYLKIIFVCVLGGILTAVVKKHSPEISLLLSIAIIAVCTSFVIDISMQIKTQSRSIDILSYMPTEMFLPMAKSIVVSVITQIACGLCKDSGQSAVAYGLEFTGNIVIILCMIPLIDMLFRVLGGMV
jgi:stage III sporulation protein AD